MSFGVVLFASTHLAIRAEKLAKEKGLYVACPCSAPPKLRLRRLSAVFLGTKSRIEEILNQAGLQTEGVHCLD